jgi:hypothetical protein
MFTEVEGIIRSRKSKGRHTMAHEKGQKDKQLSTKHYTGKWRLCNRTTDLEFGSEAVFLPLALVLLLQIWWRVIEKVSIKNK